MKAKTREPKPFPAFRFHKEHEPKLVQSELEARDLGAEWGTWAEIFGEKPVPSSTPPGPDEAPPEDGDPIEKMTVAELKAELVGLGKTDEDLKGLKKAELIEMLLASDEAE